MTLLAIVLYRYYMITRKNQIYEWYQLYRPLWMKDCAVCLFYNLAFIETFLWVIFVFELVWYFK